MSDFDFESPQGFPEPLPAGEQLIWLGSPDAWTLAKEAFHVRKVALYFAILIIWSVASALHDGRPELAWSGAVWLAGFAAAAIGLLMLLAWATARTTVYSITSRRVVMRFGIALPMSINLPFKVIGSASLKLNPDGSGDIALAIVGSQRTSWLVLWPHARPWRASAPEPMLRAVPNAQAVGRELGAAMRLAEGAAGTTSQPRAARSGAREPRPSSEALAS